MNKNLLLVLLIIFAMAPASWASRSTGEYEDNEITVLDAETFIKIAQSSAGLEIIQLFKVDGNRVNLVDAIQLNEKSVNFKPLLQYRHLKIEEKDSF